MKTSDISNLAVCRAYADSIASKGPGGAFYRRVDWPEDLLIQRTGCHVKVAYSAMERALRHGLIECGVTLRSGWLTDEGEKLLVRARDISCLAAATRANSINGLEK